jgi:hypothetical protein
MTLGIVDERELVRRAHHLAMGLHLGPRRGQMGQKVRMADDERTMARLYTLVPGWLASWSRRHAARSPTASAFSSLASGTNATPQSSQRTCSPGLRVPPDMAYTA